MARARAARRARLPASASSPPRPVGVRASTSASREMVGELQHAYRSTRSRLATCSVDRTRRRTADDASAPEVRPAGEVAAQLGEPVAHTSTTSAPRTSLVGVMADTPTVGSCRIRVGSSSPGSARRRSSASPTSGSARSRTPVTSRNRRLRRRPRAARRRARRCTRSTSSSTRVPAEPRDQVVVWVGVGRERATWSATREFDDAAGRGGRSVADRADLPARRCPPSLVDRPAPGARRPASAAAGGVISVVTSTTMRTRRTEFVAEHPLGEADRWRR